MTSFPEGKSLAKPEELKENLALREKAIRWEVSSKELLLETWNFL